MKLRMKCPKCGYWNRIDANKLFIEQETKEPKVKVFLPSYLPLKTAMCSKCGHVIAEERELIRIVKS